MTLPRRHLLMAPPLAASLAALPAWAHADPVFERKLQALVDDAQMPLFGLAACALREGRVVQQGAAGLRRLLADGTSLPATTDTLYRIASVSKLIVAVGLMRLVDEGRFDLDADLSKLLGWRLRHPQYPSTPISARLLLTHRSGLTDEGGLFFPIPIALEQVLSPGGEKYAAKAWGAHAPGRFFQYCNLGYGVLGQAMECATGERFDRLMQRLVFTPLGIAGGFEPASLGAAEFAKLATLYRKQRADDASERWDLAGPWHPQADDYRGQLPKPLDPGTYKVGSNGSVYGPQGRARIGVEGLASIAAMLLAGGKHQGKTFLSAAAVKALCTEQWRYEPAKPNGATVENGDKLDGLFLAWGLGVQHFSDQGRNVWGHFGFAYGLRSGLFFEPETGRGICYAIGGSGADPGLHRGRHSAMPIWEERLHELLWATAA